MNVHIKQQYYAIAKYIIISHKNRRKYNIYKLSSGKGMHNFPFAVCLDE